MTDEEAESRTAKSLPSERRNLGNQPDEIVNLSPFQVNASSDMGYEATETLAGSRLNTPLKDVATQINVMTSEFLEDLAITTLDDAMQYSLNTENRFEDLDVSDPAGLGSSDTTNVIGGGEGRTRSLAAPNKSHDFFDTFVRMDSYNTERFTFASGPNAILFGNSGPAGTIDTTFKRAQPARRFAEVSNRLSSTGSVRFTADFNQPIIRNRLALRIAGLNDRDKSWRKPAFYNQERIYAAISAAPYKTVKLRAYYERAQFYQWPAKNTLVQDHVTPWIEAGRPAYNNHISVGELPSPAVVPGTITLQRPQAPLRPIIVYDGTGLQPGPVGPWMNTVISKGYEQLTPAPDRFERSIIDQGLYPYDVNYSGNLAQARFDSWVRGAIVEANPWRNLFVEAGINQEQVRHRGIDFLDGRVQELNVDANLFLDDRVTPNPNFGRYYFEDGYAGVNNTSRKGFGTKDQRRASASYDLDFQNHEGWTRWLGRHRAAVLVEHVESINTIAQSLLQVVGTDNSFINRSSNANLQTSRLAAFRYYIDPRHMAAILPFDPNVDGQITQPGWVDASGKQVYLASWDPSVPTNNFRANRTQVDSLAFVTQSYFLNRRIAVSYGRRRDDVDIQQTPSLQSGPVDWDFFRLVRSGLPWTTVKSETPRNEIKSVVLHPVSWLSLSYAQSSTQQVRAEVRRNLDGSVAKLGAGVGKDYGITLRWKNLVSLRIGKYENSAIGAPSSLRNATPTPTVTALGNQIIPTVAALERTVQMTSPNFDPNDPTRVDPALLSAKYAPFQQAVADILRNGNAAGASITNVYDVLSDRDAEGYEVTIIGNPTPNWRISITGSKNTAAEANIGGQYLAFIKERLPIWGSPQYIDQPIPQTAPVGNTIRQVLAVAVQNWNYLRMSEGILSNNQRKYRATATTRYAFNRGRLKGSFLGANYLWRSPAAVAYRRVTITDNPFVVPGVVESAIEVNNPTDPIRGGPITSFDVFLGHQHRLFKNRVQWRTQLNIRNALNRDDLLVQRAMSTGQGAIFTPQQPRSFILTNTFSF